MNQNLQKTCDIINLVLLAIVAQSDNEADTSENSGYDDLDNLSESDGNSCFYKESKENRFAYEC